ncbi:TIGR02147 family protein [Bdellovibrio sp. HCB337]|uniref:TIGR02147 family protein n=1 Tax=Bdellovibrio sp. HCB337 TaxID=3394358 RepID=UPI0039A572D6
MAVNSREFLFKIYTDKKSRNTNYSIRAFARDLSIPSGRLTEIFNGKRNLTEKLGLRISEKLSLNDTESTSFLDTIRHEKKTKKKPQQGKQIPLEEFEKVFSPNALAILSLMETRGFRSDITYMAQRLSLSEQEISTLVNSLAQMGYISIDSRGRMKPTHSSTYTTDGIPAQSIRNHHKKVLNRVIENIDNVALTDRDVTSMTIAVDKAKLEAAKKKIAKFRRSLTKYLETGRKTEVYTLNVQLFPVSKN